MSKSLIIGLLAIVCHFLHMPCLTITSLTTLLEYYFLVQNPSNRTI